MEITATPRANKVRNVEVALTGVYTPVQLFQLEALKKGVNFKGKSYFQLKRNKHITESADFNIYFFNLQLPSFPTNVFNHNSRGIIMLSTA